MTELLIIIISVIVPALWLAWIFRVINTQRILFEFINDEQMHPSMFWMLPDPISMDYNPIHWHRWTKRQWVKYVESLEVEK